MTKVLPLPSNLEISSDQDFLDKQTTYVQVLLYICIVQNITNLTAWEVIRELHQVIVNSLLILTRCSKYQMCS